MSADKCPPKSSQSTGRSNYQGSQPFFLEPLARSVPAIHHASVMPREIKASIVPSQVGLPAGLSAIWLVLTAGRKILRGFGPRAGRSVGARPVGRTDRSVKSAIRPKKKMIGRLADQGARGRIGPENLKSNSCRAPAGFLILDDPIYRDLETRTATASGAQAAANAATRICIQNRVPRLVETRLREELERIVDSIRSPFEYNETTGRIRSKA